MSDLQNLEPTQEELLEILEEQDKSITELKSTIQTLQSNNSKLSEQNKKLLDLTKNEQSLSEQVKTLKSQLTTKSVALISAEDKLSQANARVEFAEKLTEKAEEKVKYAEQHQRVEYKDKQVSVPYEKCKECNKDALEKKKTEYEALKSLVSVKKYSHETLIGFLFLYSVIFTILSACRNEVVFDDIKAFWVQIGKFFASAFNLAKNGILNASALGDMIPQHIVAVIVHWLIIIILTVILIALIGFALIYLGSKAYEVFIEDRLDNATFGYMLILLALLVVFGDIAKDILKLNLMWEYIIAIIIWFVVRKGIEMFRDTQSW